MLLFTPGPTPIPESIRQAMATPTLHHRTKEFEAIFAKAKSALKIMLEMPEVLLLASSGTGAMEACLLSLTTSKILSINCGKFGERWGKIAKAHNVDCKEIKHEWDTPASAEEVLEAIKADSRIDALALQVCESAGGLRLSVESIAKSIKNYNPNIMIIADGITAMGVEKIDTTHIDALIGGSQKAFMLPPAMSIIGLSNAAIKRIEERNIGLYFNLAIELKNQRKNTTAWTAPTTITQGLVKYFKIIESMGATILGKEILGQNKSREWDTNALQTGIESIYAHTKKLSLSTRAAIKALGLALYPKSPALAMSAVLERKNAVQIRAELKKLGVNVAAGQDSIKEQIFRINHMGLIEIYEASWVVNALEMALDRLGLRKFDGAGNAAFLSEFYAK